MSSSLGSKAASGAVWATIDKFGTMVLQFVVNLILARLLIPSDFGAIGMLAIFIAVSQVLIDGGFGSALIQKKYPTQTDFSTIFYWNLAFSSFLYFILFFCAPFISEFFSMPILKGVLRGIGLTLITNSILVIQKVRLQKQLAFKTIAVSNLSSYVVASSLGIGIAYYGGGVWSLVIMQIIYTIIAVIVLYIITRWQPSLCFSRQSMRELFGFGGYMMAANILQEICRNLQGLIIGRKFSAAQMGYYSQAYKLEHISSYSIPQVIVQVMYPVYSSIQDDTQRLVEMLSMNIRIISFIIFPITALLILIAEPLIIALYGDKWLQSVPYYQVLCIGSFFVCLQNINFYVVAALGKSKILFKWSFYKWGFLLAALLIGMNFGMFGILWGMVTSSLNIYLVNAFLATHYTGTNIWHQLYTLLPIFIITLSAFTVGLLTHLYFSSFIFTALIFVITYFLLAFFLKLKALSETQTLLLRILNR